MPGKVGERKQLSNSEALGLYMHVLLSITHLPTYSNNPDCPALSCKFSCTSLYTCAVVKFACPVCLC